MPVYKRKRSMKPYQRKTRRKTNRMLTQRVVQLTPALKGTGFPSQLRTKLRYCDVITLTSTLGSVATHAFRMNSLFDPDASGAGHQPYYYDQITALYNRYSVQNAKLTAKFSLIANTISTTQPSGPCVIGVKSDDDGTLASTDPNTLMEENDSITEFINNPLGGNNVKTIEVDFNPKRDLGILATNDANVVVTNTNPTRAWFANLFMFEKGLASPTSVLVKIEIVYDVIFSELKDIAGS